MHVRCPNPRAAPSCALDRQTVRPRTGVFLTVQWGRTPDEAEKAGRGGLLWWGPRQLEPGQGLVPCCRRGPGRVTSGEHTSCLEAASAKTGITRARTGAFVGSGSRQHGELVFHVIRDHRDPVPCLTHTGKERSRGTGEELACHGVKRTAGGER